MILYKELAYRIVGAAQEVHRILGPGFLENIYGDALAHEFTLRRIPFECQVPLPIVYKGAELGVYRPDFVVDKTIILEIKAVSALVDAHAAQAIHYLAATGLRLAILLNFGSNSLDMRRIVK